MTAFMSDDSTDKDGVRMIILYLLNLMKGTLLRLHLNCQPRSKAVNAKTFSYHSFHPLLNFFTFRLKMLIKKRFHDQLIRAQCTLKNL